MKKITYLMYFLLMIMLFSCGKSFQYISEQEKELFIYELADTFALLLKPDLDTVIFNVTNKNIYFQEEAGIMTPETFFFEVFDVKFESNTGLSGIMNKNMGLSPSYVWIEIQKKSNTEFNGFLNDTLYNYNINGKQYPELFVFAAKKGQSPMLYFTKEEGIVFIDSTSSGNSYSLIEYIKSE